MANIMTRIFTLTLIVFISYGSFGQEKKWNYETGALEHDVTYEVAKKSFVIKKINDSTYKVKVNNLMNYVEYPYSRDFLKDSIGKPNGQLIVIQKRGKPYAMLNYFNGKQIGTNIIYYGKNKKYNSTTYDSSHTIIADSTWYINGNLEKAFNKEKSSYKSFYGNGNISEDVIINFEKGTAIKKVFSDTGHFMWEKYIIDMRQYLP